MINDAHVRIIRDKMVTGIIPIVNMKYIMTFKNIGVLLRTSLNPLSFLL